jgi:ribosomal protein S18 acetylase RimI-like enzyme
VQENHDGNLAAYYILLLDKSNIELFYTENDDEAMKEIAYLAQIVVSPQFRGSGTGLKAMDAIQKSCLSAQKKRLILEVNSKANAFAWYLNQGFSEIGAQVFLEKKLS